MDEQTPSDGDQLGEDETAGVIAVPGFQEGGYVARTGIALVHEGEYVLPAPGSEAAITVGAAGRRAGPVVNYYFPVAIQVVGMPTSEQLRRIAEYVYDELVTALGTV